MAISMEMIHMAKSWPRKDQSDRFDWSQDCRAILQIKDNIVYDSVLSRVLKCKTAVI